MTAVAMYKPNLQSVLAVERGLDRCSYHTEWLTHPPDCACNTARHCGHQALYSKHALYCFIHASPEELDRL